MEKTHTEERAGNCMGREVETSKCEEKHPEQATHAQSRNEDDRETQHDDEGEEKDTCN